MEIISPLPPHDIFTDRHKLATSPAFDNSPNTNHNPLANTHIQHVAVIGGGYSGVVSAAHLSRYGFSVRLFERGTHVGGVWRFDARVPDDPPVPNDVPEPAHDAGPLGHASFPYGSHTDAELAHAPPGPCYAGLRNNVPTTLMKSTIVDWSAGTPEFVTHNEVEGYIRSVVDAAGIEPLIEFDTAVLGVSKQQQQWPAGRKWTVRTRTLHRHHSTTTSLTFSERDWTFDAVVCASGHYQVPRIPNIPGLAELKALFPGRISHSKRYRDPKSSGFAGKTILLVGAGVSSLDILKETAGIAHKVYQSSRGGQFDLPTTMFPAVDNVERVAGVVRFELAGHLPHVASLEPDEHIPGVVHLQDGTILRGIDYIVLATGYVTSYPYLGPRLQKPELQLEAARKQRDQEVVVTADGLITHNLHKDIFHIQDPTLAFVGVPYHISTFSFFDVQAQVVARVFAGHARLPSRDDMAAEFEARWKKPLVGGDGEASSKEQDENLNRLGKTFHTVYGREDKVTDEFVAWVNPQVEAAGGRPIQIHGPAWRARYAEMRETSRGVRGAWPVKRN